MKRRLAGTGVIAASTDVELVSAVSSGADVVVDVALDGRSEARRYGEEFDVFTGTSDQQLRLLSGSTVIVDACRFTRGAPR